ncbi:ATP-dependent RNA helicase RhlB [Zooshikella ganghwensis]|uniref:ATP-dependent RNA helicase RhlB n=1 Tax=Zooshikella ganghwensis TaxID=202772 RepID=UPI001F377910
MLKRIKHILKKRTDTAQESTTHHASTTTPGKTNPNQTGDHKKAARNQQKTTRQHQNKRKPDHRAPNTRRQTNWDISQFVVHPEPGKTRFHDFNLPSPLMHAIQDQGFQYCTPIQAEVLGITLEGCDAIGKAQTGTGKTAAFLISTIKQLLEVPPPEPRYTGEPRALVLAPTRELALQICKDAEALTKYTPLNVINLVGGMDYEKQLRQLNTDYCDIVVATPGRLLDFLQRRDIFLDLIEILIIDEADRMLDMGFIPQVRRIVRATPRCGDRQTLLFSATFTQDILNLSEQWTYKPTKVEIEPETVATNTVEQKLYLVTEQDKFTVLCNILQEQGECRTIVFANRRDETRHIADKLKHQGFKAALLSGEVHQQKRIKTLENFKSGVITVMVATDVAGRGIHIDDVNLVINYALPEDPEDYVHRIGRTGRAGKKGMAISFAGENDAFALPAIEALLGKKLDYQQPPENVFKPLDIPPQKMQRRPPRKHHKKYQR